MLPAHGQIKEMQALHHTLLELEATHARAKEAYVR